MAWGPVNVPGVTSFNKRTGDVMPQKGDYTAEDVGALPVGWKPSIEDLLDALKYRLINGKPLNKNIQLTAKDVGAAAAGHTHTASELDFKIFHAGTAAPADTSLLWIDTTATTGGLKYHNGTAWVPVPVSTT